MEDYILDGGILVKEDGRISKVLKFEEVEQYKKRSDLEVRPIL